VNGVLAGAVDRVVADTEAEQLTRARAFERDGAGIFNEWYGIRPTSEDRWTAFGSDPLVEIELSGDEVRALIAAAAASKRRAIRAVRPRPRAVYRWAHEWECADDPSGAIADAIGWYFGVTDPSPQSVFAPGGEGFWIAELGTHITPADPAEDDDPRARYFDEPWTMRASDRRGESTPSALIEGLELRRLMSEADQLFRCVTTAREALARQRQSAGRYGAARAFPASVRGAILNGLARAELCFQAVTPTDSADAWFKDATRRLDIALERARGDDDDEHGYGIATLHEIARDLRADVEGAGEKRPPIVPSPLVELLLQTERTPQNIAAVLAWLRN
jgi:hypothetical protein